MDLMKKFFEILFILLIIGAIFFGIFYYLLMRNNCHVPVGYSIGQVDNRFKVSQDDILTAAEDAANRWNVETNTDLFDYNPSSKLKINLIYDQRQADLDKINAEMQKLTNTKTTVENANEQYKMMLGTYQSDLANYNSLVDYWNTQGGAPPDIFNKLQQSKAELDQRRNDLIQMANTLNLQAQNFNENLDNLKAQLDSRKNLIITQGIYEPSTNTINIYTFGDTDELRLVLMHELGHALGLGHGNNPVSLTYPLLDQQDLKNPGLTPEDINLLKAHCNLDFSLTGALERIRLAI